MLARSAGDSIFAPLAAGVRQVDGNIRIVPNGPDRPRNPSTSDNLDPLGHYERPASKVEGLVRRMPGGSSSLPGRTTQLSSSAPKECARWKAENLFRESSARAGTSGV